MTKLLVAGFLICSIFSCTFTTQKKSQLFVNQELMEKSIQSVQAARQIEMTVETTNDRDSVLVVKLTVNSEIPDDSLNESRAGQIVASFITILSDLNTYSSCKVVFIKKEADNISSIRAKSFVFPMTAALVTRVVNFKDSSRTSMGYIDTSWTYINKDLKLSLSLKPNWFLVSEENDSIVYYPVGSDVGQLPQYRTDSTRKVTFRTLQNLEPGNNHRVLQVTKYNRALKSVNKADLEYQGPEITLGLSMNHFDSENEYLKELYILFFGKKLSTKEIRTFHFGNADFRGYHFERAGKNGKTINFLTLMKRFRSVSLGMTIIYADEKEFQDIRRALSGLEINEHKKYADYQRMMVN